MRSRRSPLVSNTGMRTLASSIFTWDMIALAPVLDEERQVTAHPPVGQEGKCVADHRHGKHHRVGLRRRQLAEQRPADYLKEIEQNVIVNDVLPPGEYVPIIPK